MRPINPEALVQLIKKHTHYEFTDPKLLLEALTHPSSSGLNNQKLVIGVVSMTQLNKNVNEQEKYRRRARLMV